MKKLIYLAVSFIIQHSAFSQEKPDNGIYLIDGNNKNAAQAEQGIRVPLSPLFFEGDPDTYESLTVNKTSFVPFHLAAAPVIQRDKDNAEVIVHLTNDAVETLRRFSGEHIMNDVAVIVDGQVISIYKLSGVVSNGVIKISTGTVAACTSVSRHLKIAFKS